MTPAGIKPATFQFVAQHLNHCATRYKSKSDGGLVVACNMLQSWGELWNHQKRMPHENSQTTELSHGTLLSTPPASHTTDHHQWINNKANFIYIKDLQALTLRQQYIHTQDNSSNLSGSRVHQRGNNLLHPFQQGNKGQRSPWPKDMKISCRM